MSSNPETPLTLTARCLCNKHIFKAEIPPSKLPLPAYACHCTSCRHATGALYSIDTRWPVPRSSIDVSSLSVYTFSKRIQILFCGTCSTPMFFRSPQFEERELGVFTGTVENVKRDGEVMRLESNIFVGDTGDGGASVWMKHNGVDGVGEEVKRYKSGSEDAPVELLPSDWPPAENLTGYENRVEDSVPIRCHCKGVNFVLHRGNYEGKSKEELPWFVDPDTHKTLAKPCACDSCRLFSGVDVFYWTYTFLTNITAPDGKVLAQHKNDLCALVDSKDPSIGSLRYYASRDDVQRYFCSTCSASVFYATDSRPDFVDVAIGLLDAKDGARAEGMLSWTYGKVGYAEDAHGGWRDAWVKGMEKEAEEYRKERGYPNSSYLLKWEAEG